MTKDTTPKGPADGSAAFDKLNTADRERVTGALRSGASRREVTGWLMAAGATAATAGSLVTAASEAIAATPKKGGMVKAAFHLLGPNDTLDPISFISDKDYACGRAHYNSLVQLSDKIVPQPELAESFGPNNDASEWTLQHPPGRPLP